MQHPMSAAQRWRIQLCGLTALMAAMGIGRFAFTAVLPAMQSDLGFDDRAAGLMASFNLFGYLVGVVLGGRLSHHRRGLGLRIGLILGVACILLMAPPLDMTVWNVVRFGAGVASGMIFSLSTAFVLESGAATGSTGAAVHFSGVGWGIALSGLITQCLPGWQLSWLCLGTFALALLLPAWTLPGHSHAAMTARPAAPDERTNSGKILFWLLLAAYSLEGMGYIVSGTFIVRVLKQAPETAALGSVAWILAGLAAAPSLLLWSLLARRTGPWIALSVAYIAQAIGIVLPLWGGALPGLLSAMLFGGTFIGIVSLSLSLAARLRPHQAGQAAAFATALYSVGQILGPLLAGLTAGKDGDFTLPLSGAALAVLASALLSLLSFAYEKGKGNVPCPTSTSRSPAKA